MIRPSSFLPPALYVPVGAGNSGGFMPALFSFVLEPPVSSAERGQRIWPDVCDAGRLALWFGYITANQAIPRTFICVDCIHSGADIRQDTPRQNAYTDHVNPSFRLDQSTAGVSACPSEKMDISTDLKMGN